MRVRGWVLVRVGGERVGSGEGWGERVGSSEGGEGKRWVLVRVRRERVGFGEGGEGEGEFWE